VIISYKNHWVLWLDSLFGKTDLTSLSFGKPRAIMLNQINMKFRVRALKYLIPPKTCAIQCR